jgi:uncharacterized protein YciW
LLLTPGWRDMQDAPVAEIAARQWESANREALAALSALPRARWLSVSYESFVADRAHVIDRICSFARLPRSERLAAHLRAPQPLSRHTLTPPAPDKWRKNEARLAPHLAHARSFYRQIEAFDVSEGAMLPALAK